MASFVEKVDAVDGYLKSIGIFLGTYGLAVFLVVYYTVKLYPEVREERGMWIEEIAAIREIVDPETRPLTRLQAEAVMGLATKAFLRDVERGLTYFVYGDRRSDGMGSVEGGVAAWGERFRMSNAADGRDFVVLVERFDGLLGRQVEEAEGHVQQVIAEALEVAARNFYDLSSLGFAGGTLEDLWFGVVDEWHEEWRPTQDEMVGLFAVTIRMFADFADGHPGRNPDNERYVALRRRMSSGASLAQIVRGMHSDLETRLGMALDRSEGRLTEVLVGGAGPR